jgi:hypothetical protein
MYCFVCLLKVATTVDVDCMPSVTEVRVPKLADPVKKSTFLVMNWETFPVALTTEVSDDRMHSSVVFSFYNKQK